jgi:ERCC4-related helicase
MKNEVLQLQSYKAIENLLTGYVAEDFQCVDFIKALYFKCGVWTYDTGLGKTLEASGVMKMLVNEIPSRRFIMFIEKGQLSQTPKKIRDATGLSILTVTGEAADIEAKLFNRNFLNYQVLMLTHDTLNNPTVMRLLYDVKGSYCGIFVDEVHKVSNFRESQSAWMLRALLRNFEYRYGMTATPITTKLSQLVDIAHMFDWKRFLDLTELTRAVERGYSLVEIFPDFFFNRTRRDLGIISNYRTHMVMVEPEPHQVGKFGMGLTKITKGPDAVRQATELTSIIKNNLPNRGLVYINQHKVREWVLPFLESAGIRFDCIHGKVTNMAKRDDIMQRFNNGELDVVITSVTTALDLDCEYVIFYEFCTDIKQMMGRAQRGLNPKTLDLYFMFTLKTGEIEYFMKYIYERSLSIQEVLKKDYSELVEAGLKLVAMQGRVDGVW